MYKKTPLLFLLCFISFYTLKAQILDAEGFDIIDNFVDSMSYIYHEYEIDVEHNEGLFVIKTRSFESNYGMMDSTGKIIIPVIYQYLTPSQYGLIVAKKNDKWGVIDKTQNLIIPYQYQSMHIYNSNLIEAGSSKENYLLFNRDGKLISDSLYTYIYTEKYNFQTTVDLNNRRGVVNSNAKEIIKPHYQYLNVLDSNLIEALKFGNEKYGVIDTTNTVILPFEYDEIVSLVKNYIIVRKEDKFYLIDRKANILKTFDYDKVGFFYNNFAIVTKNGKKGVINTELKEVIPVKYDLIGNDGAAFEANGIGAISINGKLGFIDTLNNEIIKPIYKNADVSDYGDSDLVIINIENEKSKAQTYILINFKTGKEILRSEDVNNISPHLISFEKRGKHAIFSLAQKELVSDYEYDFIEHTSADSSSFIVVKNGKYGFVNSKTGKRVTEIKYEYLYNFINPNLAVVEENGKYGVINRTTLKYHILPKYKHINMRWTSSNATLVKINVTDDEEGYLSRRGKEVIPPVYQDVNSNACQDHFLVRQNNKWGVINMKNEIIVPLEYDRIKIFSCYSEYSSMPIYEVTKEQETYCINLKNERVDCKQ